jgi:uncharacterized membrane protein
MSWDRWLIELAVYAVACPMLVTAYRRSMRSFATLVAAIVFGLLIELYFVYLGNELDGVPYEYGRFLVMVADVPLWVGIGWGIIVHAAGEAAERIDAPEIVKAISAGLLAVSLDVVLDPVAHSRGWWSWGGEARGGFFGVPYDNFLGWMMIVTYFVLFIRAGFRRWPAGTKTWRDWAIPCGAILPSMVAVAVTQFGLDWLYDEISQPLTFLVVMGPLLVVAARAFLRTPAHPASSWYVSVVPVLFHAIFLGVALIAGVWRSHSSLILVMPLAATASVAGFVGVRPASSPS